MMTPNDSAPQEAAFRPQRRVVRGVCLLLLGSALIGSLPRPTWIDVTVPESSEAGANGRIAFRTARRLVELSGKGATADGTELNGPCLADDGRTLYFTRSRSGVHADIVRSRLNGSHWSRPEPVREINSVDEDRRVTISADNRSLIVASNRSGTRGGLDLWESTNTTGRWSRPKNLGAAINTAAYESDPALSPDGLMLLFVREVDGRKELFVSRRERVAAPWSLPQPVASVNSLTGDKICPAFAPDERHVWVLVEPPESRFNSAASQWFQASLENERIGAAVPVREALAAAGDLFDPTFSADGHSLVFARIHDGSSQLYQAQAEWVVSRLSVSTAHLDRFGRAKWGVPIGLVILFVVISGITRQTASAVSSPAPKKSPQTPTTATSTTTFDAPVRRSAPPANPLANWKAELPAAPVRAASSRPSESIAHREPTKSVPSTVTKAPTEIPASRRRAGRRLAGSLSLALLLLFGIWSRDHWLPTESAFVLPDLSQFQEFRDLTAPTRDELSILARASTARETAPDPQAVATESATMRQTARWPNEFVAVRVPAPWFVAAAAIPELSGIAKVTALARAATLGPAIRADRGFVEHIPAEPIALAAAEPAPEKPITTTAVIVTRGPGDPPLTAAMSGFTPVAWPNGMQSPARLSLTPNELLPIPTPTISTALASRSDLGTARGNSPIAVSADADSVQPLAQPQSDLSLVVAPLNLSREPSASIGTLPTLNQASLPNLAIETRADSSVSQSDPAFTTNRFGTPALAVERPAPREAIAITLSPDVGAAPPGQEPTILLTTSSQVILELLASAPMSPLNRTETTAPVAKLVAPPLAPLAEWLRQIAMSPNSNELRSDITATSTGRDIALPLRAKETSAAAIPESVAPIFE